jgi:hypothetical protein
MLEIDCLSWASHFHMGFLIFEYF